MQTGLQAVLKRLQWSFCSSPQVFSLNNGEHDRLGTFLDTFVKEGIMVNGLQCEKQWLTYRLMSRIIRSHFERALEYGVMDWDTHLMKALSIVLLITTDCRCGDIVRSSQYTGDEFLAWRDVELRLGNNGDHVADLVMVITLRAEEVKSTPSSMSFLCIYRYPQREEKSINVEER